VAARPRRTRRCDYLTPTEVASHLLRAMLLPHTLLPSFSLLLHAYLSACLPACLPARVTACPPFFLPACMHPVRALTMSRT
jgi:hypothetical protein